MNIDETIDAFRRGVLDLDCKRIVLRQNRDGGERFEGPGYVRQAEDGSLEFKLYAVKLENVKPMGHLEALSKAVAGQLHADDYFYALTAVGHDGTSWTAARILPAPHWDMRDKSVLVTGKMQSIVACLERPQSNHYLRLSFFDEFEVPLHFMSETEEHGNKYMVRDRATFEACDSQFEVRKREGSDATVIEVTSGSSFPTAFHLRVQEALQYITGKSAFWGARIESCGDKLEVELASPQRKSLRTQFDPPISPHSIDFYKYGWQLFARYLVYVVAKTEGTHWNPVAYHLYNTCESSANSVDAWAIGIAVAVEALASLIQLPDDEAKAQRVSLFQDRIRKWVDEQEDFADLIPRVKGLIDSMGNKRPQDALHALAESGHVDKGYVSAWGELRNRHVHPKLKDLKKPDAIDYQKLLDRIHRVETLVRQLTFYLIGYEGPFTDYGATNFPSKQYPLTGGGIPPEAPQKSNPGHLTRLARMIRGWFGSVKGSL